jgi:hypothetical protein
VGLGEQLGGFDFSLEAVPTRSISGALVGSSEAVRDLPLRLVVDGAESGGEGGEVATTVTDAFGRFTFLNVPPGSYVVTLGDTIAGYVFDAVATERPRLPHSTGDLTMVSVPTGPNGMMLSVLSTRRSTSWLAAPVTVQDTDVENLALALRRGASLVTEVTGDTGRAADIGIVAVQMGVGGWAARVSHADTRDPNRHVIDGLRPGSYSLGLVTGIAGHFSCDGVDAILAPVPVTDSTAVVHCKLSLVPSGATIEGVVARSASGSDASEIGVVAFPADATQVYLGPNARRFSAAGANNRGEYRLTGLPPGRYLVAAVEAEGLGKVYDAEFLRIVRARAAHIGVGPGETARANLVFR